MNIHSVKKFWIIIYEMLQKYGDINIVLDKLGLSMEDIPNYLIVIRDFIVSGLRYENAHYIYKVAIIKGDFENDILIFNDESDLMSFMDKNKDAHVLTNFKGLPNKNIEWDTQNTMELISKNIDTKIKEKYISRIGEIANANQQ